MKQIIAKLLNRKVSIRIGTSVASAVNVYAESAHPSETGGLLLGWWENGVIVVDGAVEVKDLSATGNSWTRYQDQAQAVLDSALAAGNNKNLGYIGDWHCHPASVGASSTDLASLRHVSKQYDSPIALIVRLPGNELNLYAAHKGKIRRIQRV